jgi:hypothetical protein
MLNRWWHWESFQHARQRESLVRMRELLTRRACVDFRAPTSSSWLNLVERWFGELTGKRIRRGVFLSVEDLQKAI